MGIIPSRNLEEQRREENGVVYFDRGVVEGKNGKKYSRLAIQTHFVQRAKARWSWWKSMCVPCIRKAICSPLAPR